MQVEVVSEVLHLQFHQFSWLQQVTVETLAGVAEAGPGICLGRATAAVVLLTVNTHMLGERHRHTVRET